MRGERARRDHLYDAIRHPRRTRAALPLPSREESVAYLERVSARTRASLDDECHDASAIRCCATATSTGCSRSTRRSIRRPSCRRSSSPSSPTRPTCATTPSRAASASRAHGLSTASALVPGRRLPDRQRRPPPRLRQRAPGARGAPRALPHRRRAGHLRRVRRLRRRRRLPSARAVDRGRLALAARERARSHPASWLRVGDGFARAQLRPRRAARPDAARDPRVLVRGRRLRPLGRQAPADRAGMGGRGGHRPRARHRAPLPVGRRRADARAREPRPAQPSARCRSARTRAGAASSAASR